MDAGAQAGILKKHHQIIENVFELEERNVPKYDYHVKMWFFHFKENEQYSPLAEYPYSKFFWPMENIDQSLLC